MSTAVSRASLGHPAASRRIAASPVMTTARGQGCLVPEEQKAKNASPDFGGAVLSVIEAARRGDTRSVHEFVDRAYPQLRAYAAALMKDESTAHTLTPTAVVNEAVGELIAQGRELPAGHRKGFAYFATLMRRILIEHARAKQAQKRGGGWTRIPFDDGFSARKAQPETLIEIDRHIKWLAHAHPSQHEVVMLHVYGGLTFEEVAGVMGVEVRTVYRRWDAAKILLKERIENEDRSDAPDAPTPPIKGGR